MNMPEDRTCVFAAVMIFSLLSTILLINVTRSSQLLRHAKPFGSVAAQSAHNPLQQDLQNPIAGLPG